MRAVLIDVTKQDIYEINLEKGLENIYNAIGNNCNNIEVPIHFESKTHYGNALYCDGEILYREQDHKGAFKFDDWSYPIINNALIVGTDEEGDDIDHDVVIEDLKSKITWYKRR